MHESTDSKNAARYDCTSNDDIRTSYPNRVNMNEIVLVSRIQKKKTRCMN
jgi:hypothetical protein